MFYKITKDIADQLTRFIYAPSQAFDPYVGEQDDGAYLVSENMYEILKSHLKFKQINWSNLVKVNDAQLSPKGGGGSRTK